MMKKIKKKIALILGFKHVLMLNPLMMKIMMKKVKVRMLREKNWMKKRQMKRTKRMNIIQDLHTNLEGRDTEMTDATTHRTIIQTTQVIEDTHVIITPVNPEGQQQSFSVSSGFVSNMLNSSQDTCIDYIFNFNTESTSLVDVPVTTIAEPPFLSATILPPLPTTLITHLLKTLETDFSEFKQMNQFAATVSLIPGIVDAYLANKMHEAVKTAVQL
ncbi:hypothetical protein Tco_0612779 [Tanacetum coccineum]